MIPAAEVGLRQPPPVRMWCACGIRVDALDHPDLVAHALYVHQQQPEHQQWREAAAERAPSFEVAVVARP